MRKTADNEALPYIHTAHRALHYPLRLMSITNMFCFHVALRCFLTPLPLCSAASVQRIGQLNAFKKVADWSETTKE